MRMACLLVMMLAGCGLYFGGGGGGGVCNKPVADIPAVEMRDPYTGQCEAIGGGTNCQCEPCADEGALYPNWSNCSSSCMGLDKATCESVTSCQAEYLDTTYWGCYLVEPPGGTPVTGDCSTLTSDTCTQRDDCVAVYTGSDPAIPSATKFLRCDAEVVPPPPPACSTLTTEMDCVSRSDCDAVYTGYDCTCDSSGCVCKTEVFASCQTR